MMKIIFMMILMNFMVLGMKKFLNILYYNLMFINSFLGMFMYMEVMGIWVNLSMGYYGIDNYSFFLIILSVWIMGLMFMTLDSVSLFKLMMFMVLLLVFVMYFSSLSLMMFYLFFEVSLVPTFFLVIYWGVNPERLMAGFYLMMYTLFISLPLMVYIFWWFNFLGTFSIILMEYGLWGISLSFVDYLIMFGAFYIKLPMYIFHVWLPKAHVEAPVYGSMVLAAVLLKLGTYGLIRMMSVFIFSCLNYNYLIFSISIVGSMVVSILCMIQVDLKSLVAYSSVVHMNFLLCSMLTMNKMGFVSSYIMMIGHGLCSSGLFYMVNIYYLKSNSRIIFLNKGFLSLMPSYVIWWFFLCSANFSFPLSINFISEVLMMSVLMSWESSIIMFLAMISFFSGAYSLYMYSYVQYGVIYLEGKFSCGVLKDYLSLTMHLYPLVFMLMNMFLFY